MVDSGSPDGTADMVEREFPWVRLCRRPNIGFSAANNIVLREAEDEYVLLLNPDTELRDGTLERCLRGSTPSPRWAWSDASWCCRRASSTTRASARFPTPVSALGHFTGVGRGGARRARWPPTARRAGRGRGRRGRRRQRGLHAGPASGDRGRRPLDEGYWLYMEDLDWCYRFWQAGWRCSTTAGATSSTSRAERPGAHRARARTSPSTAAWGASIGSSRPRRPALAPLVYLGIGVKLAASLATGLVARARRRG